MDAVCNVGTDAVAESGEVLIGGAAANGDDAAGSRLLPLDTGISAASADCVATADAGTAGTTSDGCAVTVELYDLRIGEPIVGDASA